MQGVSGWAPVCVGPYSQMQVVRGGMVMLAGQIGLVPEDMVVGGREGEGARVARNVAKVLDEAGQGMEGALGVLVYFSGEYGEGVEGVEGVEEEARALVETNGGVTVGEDEGAR